MQDEFQPIEWTDFEAEAKAIVARARETAREALMGGLAEAERVREEARRRGYEEGRAEAARLETGALERVLDALDRGRKRLEAEAERDLVRLAVALAGKIVKARVALGHPVAEANVRAAIALASRRHLLEVRLHPDDLRRIEAGTAERGIAAGVRLVGDETLAPGGCLLRTAEGDVDARLDSQLAQIERELLGWGETPE
ncbi:MAG: hypothetical protein HY716_03040 [Planctomycetes bacterium]|nr:hypothetical protein [Planctomycetota bacterium]